MVYRYFFSIAYQGTPFCGWQKQPGLPTVQASLESALSQVYGRCLEVMGSSRTDRGVHATGQVAHVDLPDLIEGYRLCYRLRGILPHSIAVQDIVRVKPGSHARFDAISRSYTYHIKRTVDPFSRDRTYWFRQALNIERMRTATQLLLGSQSFKSFCKKKSSVSHHVCNVTDAGWDVKEDGYVFSITANRFLHGMVRCIVGTLLEVGKGKLSVEKFGEVIKSRDRCEAGRAVPPHGLFLTNVGYPPNCYWA